MPETYFTRDGFRFLTELKAHNEKAWFEANRQRYEEGIRQPGLRLVADLAPVLAKIAPDFTADPRPSGGSMSRINRDTRFAKDKSPYKTHMFFHFTHRASSKEAAPGFYLRIGPGDCRAGGGVWRPGPGALRAIREAIVEDTKGWSAAKRKVAAYAADCAWVGESLKSVPRGFPPENEHADDLRRKDFGVSFALSDAVVLGDGLVPALTAAFKAAVPLTAFIAEAAGLEA